MQRRHRTVAHFTFPLSAHRGRHLRCRQARFWECAKLSCTCEANFLCDGLTVALRGCFFPHADKSLGGVKLVFSFDGGGCFSLDAPIES